MTKIETAKTQDCKRADCKCQPYACKSCAPACGCRAK